MKISQAIVLALFIHTQSALAQSLERLLDAVELGRTSEVAAFLDRGLDPNSTSAEGQTILMVASRLGHMDVVKLLLQRKANVNRQSGAGDSALMLASLGGHLDVVKLLAESGAELSPRGWTALHYAAYGGSPEVVRYLLGRGANKNAVAPNWDTPLMLAVRNARFEAARALLRESPDLGHQSQNGETALAIAKAKENAEMIELLKRAGAPE
jgi:ankyrin repeat protein